MSKVKSGKPAHQCSLGELSYDGKTMANAPSCKSHHRHNGVRWYKCASCKRECCSLCLRQLAGVAKSFMQGDKNLLIYEGLHELVEWSKDAAQEPRWIHADGGGCILCCSLTEKVVKEGSDDEYDEDSEEEEVFEEEEVSEEEEEDDDKEEEVEEMEVEERSSSTETGLSSEPKHPDPLREFIVLNGVRIVRFEGENLTHQDTKVYACVTTASIDNSVDEQSCRFDLVKGEKKFYHGGCSPEEVRRRGGLL